MLLDMYYQEDNHQDEANCRVANYYDEEVRTILYRSLSHGNNLYHLGQLSASSEIHYPNTLNYVNNVICYMAKIVFVSTNYCPEKGLFAIVTQ